MAKNSSDKKIGTDPVLDGYFQQVRNNLTDIQDVIRFMSLGHQFKEFLSKHLSDALTVLWDIQHNH